MAMVKPMLQKLLDAVIESDSGPVGSRLFEIHAIEFSESYLDSVKTMLKALTGLDSRTINAIQGRIEKSDGIGLNPRTIKNIVEFLVEEILDDDDS
jgi:hypothetical protein